MRMNTSASLLRPTPEERPGRCRHGLDRQSTQAAALALVSSAIVTWNTHQMNQIINRERATGRLPDDLDLGGLSPAIHAHLNINGRYHIHPDQPPRHHDSQSSAPAG